MKAILVLLFALFALLTSASEARPRRGVRIIEPPANMRVTAVPTPRPLKEGDGTCYFRWECFDQVIKGIGVREHCDLKQKCSH